MDEQDFIDLLENANDLVQSVSSDGRFVYVNKTWINTLGYSKEEAIGMKFFDILDTECQDKCSLIFQRIMRGEKVNNIETVFIAKDGRRIAVEGNCNVKFDENGKPYRTRGIFRNITERKSLEKKLIQAYKLESLGTMAGGIAHEYNNILMGIMGFAELILRKEDTDPLIKRYAENIDKSAKRAARLTNQILSYSGQGTLKKEPVNLNTVISNLEKILLATIPKEISLRLQQCNIPDINCDETSIRELLIQLVANATESIKGSGEITISTGVVNADAEMLLSADFASNLPEGQYVFLKIQDTGTGMSEDEISRIFDPFYSTKFTGRGLGLANAHGIVKQHNGLIKVSSQPDSGSIFTVLLPVADTFASTKEHEKSPEIIKAIERRGEKKTVLIIDDELVIREVCRLMLESAGYSVLLAEDGKRGVELFKQQSDDIDLVILDMVMPGMDGPETFRRIREISTTHPVLMSSGYCEDEVMSRFKKGGIAGFIHKPYNEEGLKNKVAEILS